MPSAALNEAVEDIPRRRSPIDVVTEENFDRSDDRIRSQVGILKPQNLIKQIETTVDIPDGIDTHAFRDLGSTSD
jgi:hypothetical protein